ncbi:MAG: 30S ribosomal protein S6 [Bacteroidetes bacterium]|jgi:small subunit ribosomal protein S6|nr:30S ribosomal protein S6 [Bacteroidota bacterium]MDF1866315.1 30S ribosomal protein S6 [Saprospiraceae bacterium]
MRNYEVTFIVDPVLTGDEIKGTAQTYVDRLQSEGCKIVAVDEMGLRQLAYPINRRTTGIYYCIEFETENGVVVDPMELSLRRDERIMRFLTVKLDKFGVEYNKNKREGVIGKAKRTKMREQQEAAQKKAQKANQPHGDNLKRIEGIGPKVSEALKGYGISTFAMLAAKTPERIKEILLEIDADRFQNQDPTTWSKQAELAAAGDWDKLKAWQEDLKGGRVASSQSGSGEEE